jgi:hypothetical protein
MTVETPIAFPSSSIMLSGLFVHDTTSVATRQIGVMVTGSWLTVKEQMALLYPSGVSACTTRSSVEQSNRRSRRM